MRPVRSARLSLAARLARHATLTRRAPPRFGGRLDSGVATGESDYDTHQSLSKCLELSRRPEILLNLAPVRAQSDLGRLAALKGYLEAAPQGEHAHTVQLRVQKRESAARARQERPARLQGTAAPAPRQKPVAGAPRPTSRDKSQQKRSPTATAFIR